MPELLRIDYSTSSLFVGAVMLLGLGVLSAKQPADSPSGVPVFKMTASESTVKFGVKASVPIEGTFDKWDAALTFTSPDVSTGVLDIKIDAASVDTGSGMKNNKLKSKDFFDAKDDPYITFHS
ncbi:MAG: YceI family protein, partial [Bryobacteraceae bacterium]